MTMRIFEDVINGLYGKKDINKKENSGLGFKKDSKKDFSNTPKRKYSPAASYWRNDPDKYGNDLPKFQYKYCQTQCPTPEDFEEMIKHVPERNSSGLYDVLPSAQYPTQGFFHKKFNDVLKICQDLGADCRDLHPPKYDLNNPQILADKISHPEKYEPEYDGPREFEITYHGVKYLLKEVTYSYHPDGYDDIIQISKGLPAISDKLVYYKRAEVSWSKDASNNDLFFDMLYHTKERVKENGPYDNGEFYFPIGSEQEYNFCPNGIFPHDYGSIVVRGSKKKKYEDFVICPPNINSDTAKKVYHKH